MVQFVVAERAAALESELVAATLYRHAAACMAELFPLAGDPADRPVTAAALLAAYRRASQFIDDYASLPITVDDIAEAAGLPVRQLNAAFRWHSGSGTGVQDHLRRVRLDAARRDLLAAAPSPEDTVATVALRWGFADAGRFAMLYRKTYGESPPIAFER